MAGDMRGGSGGDGRATGDQMRIALGLRGGVSLAVWIGGACQEIDALRRSSGASGDSYWAQLLEVCDVGDVIVDVMAGASAGGLNGVIFAASQVYGFPLAGLRGAWLELGGMGKLVRPGETEGADAKYPSLLQGDEYFFTSTDKVLSDLIAGGTPPDPLPRVDLTLTATLVRPVTRPAARTQPGTEEQRRFASTFRFRQRGPDWLTDFPPKDSADLSRATARLALAARSTSSFPVAFEAAAVQATRPRSFVEGATADGSGAAVDMAGVFGDAAASKDDPFYVMDGGVLDNIPLGRALTAIAGATANGPTRRVLVYVRPGASETAAAEMPSADIATAGTAGTAPKPPPDPRSTWSVVRGVVQARLQPETIAGDLALVEEHNRRVHRSQRLRLLAFTAAEDRARLVEMADNATGAYLVQRADVEAQEILRILDDPIGILGEDPFPSVPGMTDGVWRAPLAHWDPLETQRLDGSLAGELCGRMQRSPLDFGVGPVGRLTQLLLEWARFVERSGDSDARKVAGKCKAELYRVLSMYRELMLRPRRLAWVVLAATRGEKAANWEMESLDAVEGLLHVSADHAQIVRTYLEEGRNGDEVRLTPIRQELHGRLDLLLKASPDGPRVASGTPPGATGNNLRSLALDRLLASACSLARASMPPELLPPVGTRDSAAFLHQALAGPSGTTTPVDRALLQALEKVAFPESLVGAPADRAIHFVELSSSSPTPISAAFPLLLGKRSIVKPWEIIEYRLRIPPEPIPSDNKLAGNELKNFSAFLRLRWRANDWMWGRLDAVPTLVGLLVTGPSLVAVAGAALEGRNREDAVAKLVTDLRTAVTTSTAPGDEGARETSWPRFLLDTAWSPREAEITRLAERAVDAHRTPPGTSSGKGITPADLQPLRDALICTRQWQIVAEELALQRRDKAGKPAGGAATPALSPPDTVEVANRYRIGVETLTDPHDPSDSNLIRRVVVAGRRLLDESLSGQVPKQLVGAVQAVGAVLSWSWLGDRRLFRLCRWGLTLLGLVAVGVLSLTGSEADGLSKGYALAAVPGATLLVAAVALLLVKHHRQAAGALTLGVVLVVIAAVPGGNWRSSLAVVTVAVVVVAAAFWVLHRLRPGQSRRPTTPEPVPTPSRAAG